MNEWHAFMAKNLPDANMTDSNLSYGYGVSVVMLQVLKQCNGDFSRANIMKQASNLHDACDPVLAAEDQGEYQPDELPPDQGNAVAQADGHDLGALLAT